MLPKHAGSRESARLSKPFSKIDSSVRVEIKKIISDWKQLRRSGKLDDDAW